MKRLTFLFLIAYVALVFTLSTRPGLHPPGPGFHSRDKVAHIIEYGILGVLIVVALGRSAGPSAATTFVLFVALGATVGAIDEMIQFHTPDRDMDVFDWIADVTGVALSTGILLWHASRGRAGVEEDGGKSP